MTRSASPEVTRVRGHPVHPVRRERNDALVILAMTATVVALVQFPSTVLLAALLVFAIMLGILRPSITLGAWILLMPLAALLGNYFNYVPATLLVIALAFVVPLNLVILRHKFELSQPVIIFAYLYLFITVISIIFSRSPSLSDMVHTVVFVSILIVMVSQLERSDRYRWTFNQLTLWLLAAAGIAGTLAMLDSAGAARLDIGGSVRQLANITGLALVVIIGQWFHRSHASLASSRALRSLVVRGVVVAMLALVLLGTASRGAMLAVLFALIATFWHATRQSPMARDIPSLGRRRIMILLVVTLMAVSVLPLYRYSNEQITGGTLEVRIANALEAPSTNPRREIWSSGLSQMRGHEWLIGAGAGTYRSLSGGPYAHSTFVDALATRGLIGLAILLAFIAYIGVGALRTGSPLAVGILTYTVVGHATHGSATATSLALGLGIAYGCVRILRKQQFRSNAVDGHTLIGG